jgi:hypothetical protein
LYAYTASRSLIQDCINDIFLEAFDGHDESLQMLLKSPSPDLSEFLHPGLFMAIDKNNMAIIKLLSIRLSEVLWVRNQCNKGPLYIAVEKALEDNRYLPMVTFFICCGYRIKNSYLSPIDLVENNVMDRLTMFFRAQDNASKK